MVCACVHGIAFFDFFPQEKFQLMQPKHSTYHFFMIDHPHPANSNPAKQILQKQFKSVPSKSNSKPFLQTAKQNSKP